jgi:hypothetical protein
MKLNVLEKSKIKYFEELFSSKIQEHFSTFQRSTRIYIIGDFKIVHPKCLFQ